MNGNQSLSPTVFSCRYHVVWIPECTRKAPINSSETLCGRSSVEEGRLMSGLVHILISIPPKREKVATFRWLMIYNRFERSMFFQSFGFAGGIERLAVSRFMGKPNPEEREVPVRFQQVFIVGFAGLSGYFESLKVLRASGPDIHPHPAADDREFGAAHSGMLIPCCPQ
jgi:hypothetical protein